MKTRLTFWSSQFSISAYHTTTSALQLWRSRRGKIENVPIFTEAAQSSHEYNLNIHFVSLPSQDLLCSPWKQTALGLSHPFLEVTEYRTTGLHLLPLSLPNRTTSVTSPWSYALFSSRGLLMLIPKPVLSLFNLIAWLCNAPHFYHFSILYHPVLAWYSSLPFNAYSSNLLLVVRCYCVNNASITYVGPNSVLKNTSWKHLSDKQFLFWH